VREFGKVRTAASDAGYRGGRGGGEMRCALSKVVDVDIRASNGGVEGRIADALGGGSVVYHDAWSLDVALRWMWSETIIIVGCRGLMVDQGRYRDADNDFAGMGMGMFLQRSQRKRDKVKDHGRRGSNIQGIVECVVLLHIVRRYLRQ